MDINNILFHISQCRLNLTNEKTAQAELGQKLESLNIPFTREYRLSDADIVDFAIPIDNGILAVELKLKAPKRAIYRQLCRYALHEEVKFIVLMSATSMTLPDTIHDKPSAIISLGRAWL